MQVRTSAEVIALRGRFDGRCSATVREALYRHIADRSEGDVVVDLSDVESIDVTALQLLAGATMTVERQGRRLVLRGCTPPVHRLLMFRGWRRLFHVERETALV